MEEGDLVLCTVENVTPTVTHVKLKDGRQGTIVSSEIAPGRIKNLRAYVTPNKKIVCKILDISNNHTHLSLRRVNSKEKRDVMQKYKIEQTIEVAFKQILKDNSEKIKENILKDFESLSSFIDKSKEDEKLIIKYIPKDFLESFKRIIEKKRKRLELKQQIKIKCLENDGIKRIKEIFNFSDENIEVIYISAGEFKLKLITDDFKQGKKRFQEIIEELEKKSKELNCEFYSKEEK